MAAKKKAERKPRKTRTSYQIDGLLATILTFDPTNADKMPPLLPVRGHERIIGRLRRHHLQIFGMAWQATLALEALQEELRVKEVEHQFRHIELWMRALEIIPECQEMDATRMEYRKKIRSAAQKATALTRFFRICIVNDFPEVGGKQFCVRKGNNIVVRNPDSGSVALTAMLRRMFGGMEGFHILDLSLREG